MRTSSSSLVSSLVSSSGSFFYSVLVCFWLMLTLTLTLTLTTIILSGLHSSGVLVDSLAWTSISTTHTRTRTRSRSRSRDTTTTIRLQGRADETESGISSSSTQELIDYQSDSPTFGRGENHLSAVVCEGDTVVYRTGSWYVDGVLVGEEDATPVYKLCRVETIQIVWTHNCEHGVLRGLAIDINTDTDSDNDNYNDATPSNLMAEGSTYNDGVDVDVDVGDNNNNNNPNDSDDQPKQPAILSLREPLEDVEFGPEQLIARIRDVEWQKSNNGDDDDEGETGTCPISLHESMWKENDCNTIMDASRDGM